MGSHLDPLSIGPDTTDTDLLRWLKAGHTQALTILYQRYARLVYTIAVRILDNTQEAEDLTQEIFVTFWQKETYDPKRGSLSSYLGIMARSRALDKKRSKGSYHRFLERYQTDLSGFSTAHQGNQLDQISMIERSATVQKALQDLPQEQRQVLEMAYYQGLSQSDIAQQLMLPLGTVKTRSRQGLLKLRRLLGGISP